MDAHQLKTVVFLRWALQTNRTLKAALQAELDHVKAKGSAKAESLWQMNKQHLVEAAQRELGMTLAAAERTTVIHLREILRAARAENVARRDPLDALPQGLEKMKASELKAECQRRFLPVEEKMTRPKMILMIRNQVESRAHPVEDGNSPSTADWLMTEEETEPMRKTPSHQK